MRKRRVATPGVLREREVHEGPPDPAVAVLERMNRLEPQMREGGADQAVGSVGARASEPVEKAAHLLRDRLRRRRFVVDLLATEWPAHDPHRRLGPAPLADHYLVQAGSSGREERRVPGAQPFLRQWLVVARDRILHDVEQAIDVPQRWARTGERQAEPARDRGTHRGEVELLALDGCGGERLVDPDRVQRLADRIEPDRLRLADYSPLGLARGGEWCGEQSGVRTPVGVGPDEGELRRISSHYDSEYES